ncbi:arylsulfatase B-like isoform X5 [Leptidea sinapis]|nr:arylsulfatase B-like isoform X5 [Leptidea sinapis]XP_050664392.1 arylsulfatase B-like isoform X5 [Leptidea sinapis]
MLSHNAPHAANEGAMLQAPPEQVRAQRHVESPQRRIYSAMVKMLDDSVGEIIKELQLKHILDNTIIVFVSDNGGITTGETANFASNYPLRGLKFSPFDGGIRVNGLIWSKNLTDSRYTWKGFIHVVDWLPTLLTAVGASVPKDIDGINLWESITSNNESNRNVSYEINDFDGYAAIIFNDYKLITGKVPDSYSTHEGKELKGIIGKAPPYKEALRKSATYKIFQSKGIQINISDVRKNTIRVDCNTNNYEELCHPKQDVLCLFNIKEDPCETENLSSRYPDIVETMHGLLMAEIKRSVKRKKTIFRDPKARPSLHNYTWTSWLDSVDKKTVQSK